MTGQLELTTEADAAALADLYRQAATLPYGLLRHPDEITPAYARSLAAVNAGGGLALGYYQDGELLGEIHGKHCTRVRAHSHLLTDVGVAVRPDHRGRDIGKRLFQELLARVERDRPDIYRVELYTFARNERNVAFYTQLGFREEGRYPGKNRQPNGRLETPISMAWINPGYRGLSEQIG